MQDGIEGGQQIRGTSVIAMSKLQTAMKMETEKKNNK